MKWWLVISFMLLVTTSAEAFMAPFKVEDTIEYAVAKAPLVVVGEVIDQLETPDHDKVIKVAVLEWIKGPGVPS